MRSFSTKVTNNSFTAGLTCGLVWADCTSVNIAIFNYIFQEEDTFLSITVTRLWDFSVPRVDMATVLNLPSKAKDKERCKR